MNKGYRFLLMLLTLMIAVIGIIFYTNNIRPALPSNRPPQTIDISPSSQRTPTIDSRDILLEKKRNRKPLSENDSRVRATILNFLPKGQIAGVIHEAPLYRIEYIESLDLFKVEILSTDIQSAKTQGYEWFLSQGMSQQGICDLPLQFYLNYSVTQQLPDARSTFNPLPEAC